MSEISIMLLTILTCIWGVQRVANYDRRDLAPIIIFQSLHLLALAKIIKELECLT